MRVKALFFFLLLSGTFYFGCKKENSGLVHEPDHVLHEDSIPGFSPIADSFAGSYLVSGTISNTYSPPFGPLGYDTAIIITNQIFVITKIGDSTLGANNSSLGFLYAEEFNYHARDSTGNAYCFSFDDHTYPGLDTLWFLKSDPDSIQIRYHDYLHFNSGSSHLGGRKIH